MVSSGSRTGVPAGARGRWRARLHATGRTGQLKGSQTGQLTPAIGTGCAPVPRRAPARAPARTGPPASADEQPQAPVRALVPAHLCHTARLPVRPSAGRLACRIASLPDRSSAGSAVCRTARPPDRPPASSPVCRAARPHARSPASRYVGRSAPRTACPAAGLPVPLPAQPHGRARLQPPEVWRTWALPGWTSGGLDVWRPGRLPVNRARRRGLVPDMRQRSTCRTR